MSAGTFVSDQLGLLKEAHREKSRSLLDHLVRVL